LEYKRTRQGYVDGLIELARQNPLVMVLDSDVSKASQTCDFQMVFPERFFNCGAQEGNMMSVAAGLALEGFIPYPTTFGVFACCRAGDQVRNSIAYPKTNVKIAATHCGISTGGDGASHQSNEDIAIMRSFPNMTVVAPGDYEEAKQATIAAARFTGPVYLRFGRDTYPVVPEIHNGFQIGQAKQLREGSDITLITTGIMVSEGLKAAEMLREKGYSARLIHMHTVKPLDGEAVLRAARETRRIVTAEEHSVIGGLGEAVAGFLSGEAPTPVRRVGVRDVFGESGMAGELLDRYGLRAINIYQEALELLGDS
jgi:transketolase